MTAGYQIAEAPSGALVKGSDGDTLVFQNGLWHPTPAAASALPLTGTRFVDAAVTSGNGAIVRPFKTIPEAIADLPNGGFIFLAGGVYPENLVIPSGKTWSIIGLGGGAQKLAAITGTINYKLANLSNLSFQGLELDALLTGTDDGAGVQECPLTFSQCTVAAGIACFGTTHIVNLMAAGGAYVLDGGFNTENSSMTFGPSDVRVNGLVNLLGALVTSNIRGKLLNLKNSRLIKGITADTNFSSIGFGCTFNSQTAWHGPADGSILFNDPGALANFEGVSVVVSPTQDFVENWAPKT